MRTTSYALLKPTTARYSRDFASRAAAEFSNYGYQIEGEITPVDIFPRTGHIETVVKLIKTR